MRNKFFFGAVAFFVVFLFVVFTVKVVRAATVGHVQQASVVTDVVLVSNAVVTGDVTKAVGGLVVGVGVDAVGQAV